MGCGQSREQAVAGEQPSTGRAEEAAKDDANVRSEKGTTSKSSEQPTRYDDEEDDDADSNEESTSEGKSATKIQSIGQPVLGKGKLGAVPRKKSLPSLGSSTGEQDEASGRGNAFGAPGGFKPPNRGLPKLPRIENDASDSGDAAFSLSRRSEDSSHKPSRRPEAHVVDDDDLAMVDGFIDEEDSAYTQSRGQSKPQTLKPQTYKPPPKADSDDEAFCLDSAPSSPIRKESFSKPKYTNAAELETGLLNGDLEAHKLLLHPALRASPFSPGDDPFAPHEQEKFNVLGDEYDDTPYHKYDDYEEEQEQEEADPYFSPPKKKDPWDNIQSKYAIAKKPTTPPKYSRPHTAIVMDDDDDDDWNRLGNQPRASSKPVDTWDGVQPVSNVAREHWQSVEDVDDFDVDFELESMPAPVVRHITVEEDRRKPKRVSSRNEDEDDVDDLADLDQLEADLDVGGRGNSRGKGHQTSLKYDFRRRGDEKAAAAEARAAEHARERRGNNAISSFDVDDDDDDIYNSDSDDDGYRRRRNQGRRSRNKTASSSTRKTKGRPRGGATTPSMDVDVNRIANISRGDSTENVHKGSF